MILWSALLAALGRLRRDGAVSRAPTQPQQHTCEHLNAANEDIRSILIIRNGHAV